MLAQEAHSAGFQRKTYGLMEETILGTLLQGLASRSSKVAIALYASWAGVNTLASGWPRIAGRYARSRPSPRQLNVRRCSDDRFVALKILTCEATKALSSDENQRSDEQRMLEKIAAAEPSHRGFSHNLAYFGSFDFAGPHGLHRCIVTEVLGYSIDYIRKLSDTDRRVAPSIVKRVVKQVLLGLEYLHNACGIVHTGSFDDSPLVPSQQTSPDHPRSQARQHTLPPARSSRRYLSRTLRNPFDHIRL